jgi:hypothetical protein
MSVTVDKGNGAYLETNFDADLDKLYSTMNDKNAEIKKGWTLIQTQSQKAKGETAHPFIDPIITDVKDKVNRFKDANDKRDEAVNIAFDTLMQGFDLGATPLKYMFGAMNKNIDPTKSWFDVTQLQKDISQVVNDFRNVKAVTYENAGDIKEYLGTLKKEDSKKLVHALGGDLDPAELSGEIKELYSKFRKVIDDRAEKLVELGVLDENYKIDDYLKRYYAQYIKEGQYGSKLAYDRLKKRKDLTLEERIAIGMVEDASFVISNTIADQEIQIQKATTLKIIADKFGSDQELDGYVYISDESVGGGIKKWGALAGKWVDPIVKKELDNARMIHQQLGFMEEYLYPIIDHLKVNLTVKNPATHVYNIASNLLLSGLNGDFIAVGKVLMMRAKEPNKFKALVKQANKHGLNSYLDDFEDGHIDLMPDGKDTNVVSTIWKNLYMAKDSKSGNFMRKVYDWEDKIFKLASFKRHLDDGISEKEAFKMATDVYVDYSTPLPAGVRVLDKSGLMPFLHYQYKSTPAVAKVMAKHPLRAVLMGTGVVMLGASAWTNDEEEMLTPQWADDKFNLFGVSEWVRLGNGWYINAGRMIPATKFEFEIGGIQKGVLEILNGKTPLGYNIGLKYDSDLESYGKRLLVMAENYLPSMTLGRYMQRGVHIGLGEAGIVDPKKNYYDEDMTVKELGGRALGIRRFNEEKELNSKLRDAKNLKKHNNKNPKSDKKANQKQYDTTARRIKAQANKVGFDLTADDDVSFDIKMPNFDI